MPRHGIEVRSASFEDIPFLGRLFDHAAQSAFSGPTSGRARPRPLRLAAVLDHPDCHLLTATLADGAVAGGALLAVDTLSRALGELSYSAILLVDRDCRHRGVGRALVGALTEFCDQAGAATLAMSVPPGSRDAQRFFARLGFAPLATTRLASVPLLQRSFNGGATAERRHSVLTRTRRVRLPAARPSG